MVSISRESKVELLTKLRTARYLVLRDAEAFHEAATCLEHIGQVVCGEIRNGLESYRKEILALAQQTKRHNDEDISRLFKVVREARNDAVHVGAHARHLNTRLIDLLLILEEAITSSTLAVKDLMVRTPVVAESWHLVAHVRNAMLANSFSTLPIWERTESGGCWWILTDTALMKYKRVAGKKDMTVEKAVSQGWLPLESATCVQPDTPITEVVEKMNHLPILVTDATCESRLLGIVSAFDLI